MIKVKGLPHNVKQIIDAYHNSDDFPCYRRFPIEFVIYMINMGDITFVDNKRIKVKNHDDVITAFTIPPRDSLFI